MDFEAGIWFPSFPIFQWKVQGEDGEPSAPLVGLGQSFPPSWLFSQGFTPPTHNQLGSGLRGLEGLSGGRSWAVPGTELFPKE